MTEHNRSYEKPRIVQFTAGKLAHNDAEWDRLTDQMQRHAADLRQRGWAVTCDAAPSDTWDGPSDYKGK